MFRNVKVKLKIDGKEIIIVISVPCTMETRNKVMIRRARNIFTEIALNNAEYEIDK